MILIAGMLMLGLSVLILAFFAFKKGDKLLCLVLIGILGFFMTGVAMLGYILSNRALTPTPPAYSVEEHSKQVQGVVEFVRFGTITGDKAWWLNAPGGAADRRFYANQAAEQLRMDPESVFQSIDPINCKVSNTADFLIPLQSKP